MTFEFNLGEFFMKSKERYVTVEVECAGKRRRFSYRITSSNGDLMTRSLKKLITGHVSLRVMSQLDSEMAEAVLNDGSEAVKFIGAVWSPPYSLLQEILQDRLSLQTQLEQIEGISGAPEDFFPVTIIPEKADNGQITKLILHELSLRKKLQSRIKLLSRV